MKVDKRQMKSAARLYAVQALFQMETSGQTVEAVTKEFQHLTKERILRQNRRASCRRGRQRQARAQKSASRYRHSNSSQSTSDRLQFPPLNATSD